MYAMAKLIETLHVVEAPMKLLGLAPSLTFHLSIVVSAILVLANIFLGGPASAICNTAVFSDRGRVPAAGAAAQAIRLTAHRLRCITIGYVYLRPGDVVIRP